MTYLPVKNERELADFLNADYDQEEFPPMVKFVGTVELTGQGDIGLSYTGNLDIGYLGIHAHTHKKSYVIGSGSEAGFAMVAVAADPWKVAEVQASLAEKATGNYRPCVLTNSANIMGINNRPAEIRLYLKR